MSKVSNSSSGGVSGLFLLGLLFVGLKLTGYIDWSWMWVTVPFWGALALFLVGLAGFGLLLLIVKLLGK